MSRTPEPPDWLLPSWDSLPEDPDGPPPRETPAPRGTVGLRVRTVSEVSRAIRDRVRSDDGLRDVWVEGEVGRVTVSSAGHAYFSLKDARAAIQCVWFRDDRVRSAFQPQAGLAVVAHGRIDLFEPQGALQLYVEALQPAGVGNLAVRFEELKARLAAEGLFDRARKRPLPGRPGTVAIITSPTGAVWHDVSTVLARRWPIARLLLVPCKVQGEGSAASIVTAFRHLERHLAEETAAGRAAEAPAVTILARGGGSMEDLWSFNDERVVRAVVGHPLPVVCGVGHEVDVTLADFAADVRAATPSAAAELVVPDRLEAVGLIRAAGRRADGVAVRRLAMSGRDLDGERRALAMLEPRAQLAASRERAGLLLDRAARAVEARLVRDVRRLEQTALRPARVVEGRLRTGASRLAAARASLAVLGPGATLGRGYAIVRTGTTGAVVRDAAAAPAGTVLRIDLAAGSLGAVSTGPGDETGA
ncbi:MAG: exodeoxyribonuclease VII large subunit [Chloroflexota bacterium]